MDAKPRPNQRRYLESLARMTPGQHVQKAFELTELSRRTFRDGLRVRFPNATDDELERLYLERLALCHNRRS
jgi:hypothetical protein